jgi:hypothetical protein
VLDLSDVEESHRLPDMTVTTRGRKKNSPRRIVTGRGTAASADAGPPPPTEDATAASRQRGIKNPGVASISAP